MIANASAIGASQGHEKARTMSGRRNMMANQRGADTVVMIQPTTTAMSPTGIMPPNMPPENNPAILKANSQQRTISALSAHGRPRHRKWLSTNSATDTTLRQQKPTNTANSMYRCGLNKYSLS